MSHNVIPLARNRAVYTVKETAYLLSLPESTVYRWLRTGILPGINSGRRWGIPKKRLHQWVAELTTDDPAEVTAAITKAENRRNAKENPTR